jgi:hypothetical protein
MNPFIVSGFEGKEYFCDRKNELKKLKEAFDNRRNVTLFSLRRMGKSALVKYHFENISRNANCIYTDIFPAMNFNEMTQLIVDSVTQQYGASTKDYLTKITSLVKSLGATLSFNQFTGKPELKFAIGHIKSQQKNLTEVFNFLEESNKRVLIAIDEFQQVRSFTDTNTEAFLRSLIQNFKKINFIFLGSNKGILESIFSDNSKPFYQSAQFMYLDEINKDEYSEFIIRQFGKNKIKISYDETEFILEQCRTHTYYVQYLCNRIFSKGLNCTKEIIYNTLEEILKENEPVYFNYKNLLTDIQWKLASAIAKEGKVKEPLSIAFIKKYDMNSTSSLKRALDALLKKEILIYQKEHFMVYDVYFSLWLKEKTI